MKNERTFYKYPEKSPNTDTAMMYYMFLKTTIKLTRKAAVIQYLSTTSTPTAKGINPELTVAINSSWIHPQKTEPNCTYNILNTWLDFHNPLFKEVILL